MWVQFLYQKPPCNSHQLLDQTNLRRITSSIVSHKILTLVWNAESIILLIPNTILIDTGKPKVSLSYGPTYVEKGKNVTLPVCHVTSFPPAVITWDKVLDNLAQARTVVKNGQLSIVNTQKRDNGLYKCTASNQLGHDSAVTQLNVVKLPRFTVRPPPQLEEFTLYNITVRCQATGEPTTNSHVDKGVW